MPYTLGQRTVRMVEDNGDDGITLTLARDENGTRRAVTLPEPNALSYARIRAMLEDVDEAIRNKFPEPEVPRIPDDMTPDEASMVAQRWRQEAATYNRELNRYIYDPEQPPYAGALLDIIERLTGERYGLADLPVEAFDLYVCSSLLRIWEGPSDGPVAPAVSPEQPGGSEATPETVDLAASSADSRESAESSPPGTEPAIPSHLPS